MNNFIYLKSFKAQDMHKLKMLYILKESYINFYDYEEKLTIGHPEVNVPDLVINAISKCKLKQGEVCIERGLKIKNIFMVGNQKC